MVCDDRGAADGVEAVADFTRLSALELMSLGDRERVHTALLSWLLGQDSPLPPMSRGRVAAALAGVEPTVVTSTMSSTEVKNLDVLVELEGPTSWSLAVEGKLKAREHSDQLARYSAQLSGRTRQPSKVLLSLAGDAPGVPGWRAVSYEQLASALRAENANGLGADPYARDYLSMVERLAAAVRVVESEAGARVVFDESEDEPNRAPGFCNFVTRLRLSKVLQQTWMMRLQALVLTLAPLPDLWNTEIDETNGAALVNFQRPLDDCCVGLQVQHRSLKMFSYPLSEAPSPARIAASAAVLAEMARRFGTAKAPSKTRTRGFSSITVAGAPPGRDLTNWASVVAGILAKVVVAATR